jgi:hypothetical protein
MSFSQQREQYSMWEEKGEASRAKTHLGFQSSSVVAALWVRPSGDG